jgi:dTDP-4-dehydrorhamnose 3,5-epimerase
MARVDVLPGITVFEKDSFIDDRGELYTIWKNTDTPSLNFNHDKLAVSHKNVLRGLHTDKSWKLITCLHGKIQLVVLNLETNQYTDFIIDADSNIKTSVLVPPGYYNGHLVLSDEALFYYKWSYLGEYPDVKDQQSLNWADNSIKIKWMCDNPILSERDKNTPLL